MTHIFGRDFCLGKQDWTKNERTGRMMGNPSTSHLLGTYMVSLRNWKVRNCLIYIISLWIDKDYIYDRFVQVMWPPVPEQLPLYVTFIFEHMILLYHPIKEILRKLYHYNHRAERWDLYSSSRPPVQTSSSDNTQSGSLHNWGGPLTRRALQAIYTLAFICLLRSDEVLKIRREHIEFVKDENNPEYMVLTLPFRKTHQDGRKFSHFSRVLSIADHLQWQTFNHFIFIHSMKRRPIYVPLGPWQSGLKKAKSLLAFCFKDLWPRIAHLLMKMQLW